MVSIIICSRKSQQDSFLTKNIAASIGAIPYEIIWIDNSTNKYSIFQAYDEGVSLAQYEFLCFMHEDIVFLSKDWGVIAINQMQKNDKVGMLGVIGGKIILPRYSYYWGLLNSTDLCLGEVIQGYKTKYGVYKTGHTSFPKNGPDKEVVAIDGLWMFIRRDLFSGQVHWDTHSYSGFHYYDMDMSMQVKKAGYTIEISPILIEHKSPGSHNSYFWDNYQIFHNKWDGCLPVGISTLTTAEISNYEKQMIRRIDDIYKEYKYKYINCLNSWDFRLGHFILYPLRIIRRVLRYLARIIDQLS